MRFSVSPASPGELTAACRLLYAHRPNPERDLAATRCRDMLTAGEADPAGLFAARDADGTVRGAILAQSLPGALGLAWPPRAEHSRDRVPIEDALTAAALGWLRSCGVKVCQSFGTEPDRPDFAPLERHGFRLVTRVVHLRRELDAGVDPPDSSPLSFEPFRPEVRDEFTAVLLATHRDSRDCPELNGTRTDAELLDGFRGPLAVCPGWWHLAREHGRPIGVVLFDTGAEPGARELSYLGLVPEARGRNLAGQLVRFALSAAARAGEHAVTLSVDERNAPALRVYARHGFAETDRRDVYLAVW